MPSRCPRGDHATQRVPILEELPAFFVHTVRTPSTPTSVGTTYTSSVTGFGEATPPSFDKIDDSTLGCLPGESGPDVRLAPQRAFFPRVLSFHGPLSPLDPERKPEDMEDQHQRWRELKQLLGALDHACSGLASSLKCTLYRHELWRYSFHVHQVDFWNLPLLSTDDLRGNLQILEKIRRLALDLCSLTSFMVALWNYVNLLATEWDTKWAEGIVKTLEDGFDTQGYGEIISKLTTTWVCDFTGRVPRCGVFVDCAKGYWPKLLPLFASAHAPVWVHWPSTGGITRMAIAPCTVHSSFRPSLDSIREAIADARLQPSPWHRHLAAGRVDRIAEREFMTVQEGPEKPQGHHRSRTRHVLRRVKPDENLVEFMHEFIENSVAGGKFMSRHDNTQYWSTAEMKEGDEVWVFTSTDRGPNSYAREVFPFRTAGKRVRDAIRLRPETVVFSPHFRVWMIAPFFMLTPDSGRPSLDDSDHSQERARLIAEYKRAHPPFPDAALFQRIRDIVTVNAVAHPSTLPPRPPPATQPQVGPPTAAEVEPEPLPEPADLTLAEEFVPPPPPTALRVAHVFGAPQAIGGTVHIASVMRSLVTAFGVHLAPLAPPTDEDDPSDVADERSLYDAVLALGLRPIDGFATREYQDQADALGFEDLQHARALTRVQHALSQYGANIVNQRSRIHDRQCLPAELIKTLDVNDPILVELADVWILAPSRWSAAVANPHFTVTQLSTTQRTTNEQYDGRVVTQTCWAFSTTNAAEGVVILFDPALAFYAAYVSTMASVAEIAGLCLRSGARYSLPALFQGRPQSMSADVYAMHQVDIRMRRARWTSGLRPTGSKATREDQEVWARNVSSACQDARIARVSLHRGGLSWRLANHHCARPYEAAGQPVSEDAVIFGIGTLYSVGDRTLIDDDISPQENAMLLGTFHTASPQANGQASTRTMVPPEHVWNDNCLDAPLWRDAAEQFAAGLLAKLAVSDAPLPELARNGKGWTDDLRRRCREARRVTIAVRHVARVFLASQGQVANIPPPPPPPAPPAREAPPHAAPPVRADDGLTPRDDDHPDDRSDYLPRRRPAHREREHDRDREDDRRRRHSSERDHQYRYDERDRRQRHSDEYEHRRYDDHEHSRDDDRRRMEAARYDDSQRASSSANGLKRRSNGEYYSRR